MQAGQLIPIRTDPATQFAGALAQNASALVSLAPPSPGQVAGDGKVDEGLAAGRTVQCRLRSIVIASVQNLAWEIDLWSKAQANGSPTDPALSWLVGRWTFAAGDAVQFDGAGLYYYYIDGLDQPYSDLDRLGQIHLMLVNRDSVSKIAGASGAILIQLNCEPTYGY